MATADRQQINQVDQRRRTVETEPLDHAAAQRLGRRAVAVRLLAESLVCLACSGNARTLVDVGHLVQFLETRRKRLNLVPKPVVGRLISDICGHKYHFIVRRRLRYLIFYIYFHCSAFFCKYSTFSFTLSSLKKNF